MGIEVGSSTFKVLSHLDFRKSEFSQQLPTFFRSLQVDAVL